MTRLYDITDWIEPTTTLVVWSMMEDQSRQPQLNGVSEARDGYIAGLQPTCCLERYCAGIDMVKKIKEAMEDVAKYHMKYSLSQSPVESSLLFSLNGSLLT